MTVAEAIHSATLRLEELGIEDARLEAEVLLAGAIRADRTHVLASLHDPLDEDGAARLERALERRLRHEPLAYIVGHREFYGIDFECAPGALIPRPETEMLVDVALREIDQRGADLRLLDVGTGGGAIAVAIALNAPEARVIAIDASHAALDVARRNVARYELDGRVELRQTDLLDGLGSFDVIVANLPYVSESDWESLAPEIREYEPRVALVPGPEGTEAIERLLAQAPLHLAPAGVLAIEIGDTQGERLLAHARDNFPDAQTYVMKDFAERDRVLVVRR